MIPNHPPEVGGGVRQRMLGNDELVAPVITLWADKTLIFWFSEKNHSKCWTSRWRAETQDALIIHALCIIEYDDLNQCVKFGVSEALLFYHDVRSIDVVCSLQAWKRRERHTGPFSCRTKHGQLLDVNKHYNFYKINTVVWHS